MGVFSELDLERQLIEAVSIAMEEPVLSAEEQMERRVDSIVRDLDELCAFAANAETVDLVEAQKIGLGQVKTRVDLVLSLLMARHPRGLSLVSNARS